MRSISIDNLKAGMKYDKPVFVDGDSLFVPQGISIKQKDIDRLKKWGIDEVFTDGELEVEGGKDESADILGEASSEMGTVKKKYTQIVTRFEEIADTVQNSQKINPQDIDETTDSLFKLLQQHKNELIQFILYGAEGKYDLIENSINCAVLSTVVGINLNMIQHKLLQLTTGALLHDIGMLRLPDELVSKKGKLEPEELQKMRAHPIHSYRIITKEMLYPEEIGFIGLQHHERWDGGGYPKKLSGKKIVLTARIVSVVDAFIAMVSKRPYRDSMIGYTAMRTILSDNSRRFDPEILKVFIKSLGIYPIGSIILLNNSSIGRVIETHSEAPLRPKVRILIDEGGSEFAGDDGPVVELLEEKKLFIARAIDPKSLTQKK